MKKILSILAILFSLPMYADHHLVIEINNSKKHSYSLEDNPVISFDSKRLIIKTDKIELSYQISDIVKYYFIKEDDTSISSINGDANNIHINYTNNDFILIEGIAEEDNVNVYEINGRTCHVNITRSNDSVIVELKNLPKGIYLVKVNNHSFKLIR